MLTLLFFNISFLLVPWLWVAGNDISSDMHKTNEYKELFLNRDALLNNANRVTSPRVVGGTDAGGHIDYQVLLLLDFGDGGGYGRCGGSLIAPNVVLSAAHCQMGNVNQYIVITGLYDYEDAFKNPEPNPITVLSVQDQIIHPDYQNATIDNDVMLLRLSQPVNNMEPISLNQDPSTLEVGETVRVSGWGTTSSGGSVSNVLLYADLSYISNSACNMAYNGDIDGFEMCASQSGKDSCQGDSGGPLVISDFSNGKPLLVGVVSWGIGCASPIYPGVYARVSYFYSWIISNGCSWYSSLCINEPVSVPPTPSPIPQPPTSEPTKNGPTASPIPTISCNDFPNFFDYKGDDCEWYEMYDDPGCPLYGYLGTNNFDMYAAASCCYCDGGFSGDGFCDAEEVDEPGWTDFAGEDCYWYVSYDIPGCPLYGELFSWDGTTANEACCFCRTSYDDCNLEGWADATGDDCSWYESYDSPGCPSTGSSFPNEDGVDANAACCYCKDTDNECDLEGWTDATGDDCSWYESNDSSGCPLYGSSFSNEDGVDANTACCYCKDTDNEPTSSPVRVTDNPTETSDDCDTEGWTDAGGYSCSWYIIFDEPGCPSLGSLFPNEDGVDANTACCYCKNTTDEPTPAPVSSIEYPTNTPYLSINEPSTFPGTTFIPVSSPRVSSDNVPNSNGFTTAPSPSDAATRKSFCIEFFMILFSILFFI